MIRRLLSIFWIFILLTGVAAAPAAAQSSMTLRAADNHPKGYPNVVAVENMGKKLEAATDGRIKMRMFAGGVLGDEKESIEQVQIGAIHLLRVSVGGISPVIPEVNVLNLPYLFRDQDHMHKMIDGPIGQELLDTITASPARLVGLAWMDSGSRNVYTDRPIQSPQDLRGLKIRVQANPIFIDTLHAMGGNPISMPFGELYSALQTGIVDGAENNEPSYFTQNHYTVANVFSRTRHLIIPELLVFSKRSWDRLEEKDRQLIKTMAREAQMEQRALWEAFVTDATVKLKEKNVTFVDVDIEPFVQATAPVRERYGAAYGDLITRIQALQ